MPAIYEECNTIDHLLEMEAAKSRHDFHRAAGNKTRFSYLCHELGYLHRPEQQTQATSALPRCCNFPEGRISERLEFPVLTHRNLERTREEK
jgi:hypothetical protein